MRALMEQVWEKGGVGAEGGGGGGGRGGGRGGVGQGIIFGLPPVVDGGGPGVATPGPFDSPPIGRCEERTCD